ncbi:VWA domain-containing protein [Singulisphaera sp. PoT]|uniref:VWA domain-containing protein n=1 Tax=Singulisphaera sp. PoT TaxID=3411797 RepID=UPI003BF57802
MSLRRLPVYLLLDCSESMIGDAIEAVQRGVDLLIRQLRSDPHALETVYVSIITYHATAQQVLPLTELSEVQPPALSVRPGTSLGAALNLLRECINREVRKTTTSQKGDYRPIVFLLTDGQPTDDWESVQQMTYRLTHPKIANLYAIGCGDDVDFETLHRASDIVFKLQDMTPQTLGKLFLWLTGSVQGASQGLGAGDQAGIDLTKKPEDVREVQPGSEPTYHGPARQVFLKLYCSKVRRPYLVRYRLDEEVEGYMPVAAHVLESTIDEGKGFEVPPINSSLLLGSFPCPYCSNPHAGMCSCRALFCLPDEVNPSVTCPRCLSRITLGQTGEDFAINQSAG